MPRPPLKLIHPHGSADDLLFRGNTELAAGHPERALEFYTKVLYEVCPGHICAFLNRALAYVALGYPELAVMDAYRATGICNQIRYTHPSRHSFKFKRMCKEVETYMRSEKLHLKSGDPWTQAPGCFVGSGWLSSSLAMIVLTPSCEPVDISGNPQDIKTNQQWLKLGEQEITTNPQGSEANPLGIKANSPPEIKVEPPKIQNIPQSGMVALTADQKILKSWDEFRIRAKYRLCGALWYCGHGARSNALEFIDTIKASLSGTVRPWPYDLSPLQQRDFLLLSDHIKRDIEKDLEADRNATKAMMKWKLTHVNRVEYPWNIYAPDWSLTDHVEELENFTNAYVEPCKEPSVETRSSTGVVSRATATADILSGDTIFTEQTVLQVTTTGSLSNSGFFCDTCATCIVISDKSQHQTPLPKSRMQVDAGAVRDDSHYFQHDKELHRTTMPQTLPQVKLDLEIDLYHCNLCMKAVFCCRECFDNAGGFHAELCETGVEAEIRSSYHQKAWKLTQEDLEAVGNNTLMHPKARCLYDLLLVRIYGMATVRNKNPLSLPEVRWLPGDFRGAAALQKVTEGEDQIFHPASALTDDQRKRKTLPWTFINNVRLPFSYLRSMNIDPIMDLHLADGWMINTLFAKIMHSTRITHGARYAKRYDDAGKLAYETLLPPEKFKREVWVGTISPTFSLIGVADESIGEKPNVKAIEGNLVKCVPVMDAKLVLSDDVTDPETKKICIRTGEAILRSAIPSGGFEFVRTPENVSLADWMVVEELAEAFVDYKDEEVVEDSMGMEVDDPRS